MTLSTMQLRVAENLNMLKSDDTTIQPGLVTATGITNRINDYYREMLFPLFADKFPEDFEQTTYPYPTYTATDIVASGSTYTLNSTNPIFTNSMEGFTIQNTTLSTTAKIVTFVSTTQVILDTSIGSTWNASTIYVLGNEFSFGGDTTDIMEIKSVRIKYRSTDNGYIECVLRQKKHLIEIGNEVFNPNAPYFYTTSIKIGTTQTKALGFLPFPVDRTGSWQMTYIQRPDALTSSDEPLLTVSGISQVIINAVTAWGKRVQAKYDEAQQFEEVDPRTGTVYGKGTLALIRNYKPRRANKERTRLSRTSIAIQMRRV